MTIGKQIVAIGFAHFLLTASSIVGAALLAVNALRAGLEHVGLLGQLLNRLAVVLAQPAATVVLSHLDKDSGWFWPLLGVNSVLWALVLVGVFRVVRRRSRHANT